MKTRLPLLPFALLLGCNSAAGPAPEPRPPVTAAVAATGAAATLAAGKPVETTETRAYGCGVKYGS